MTGTKDGNADSLSHRKPPNNWLDRRCKTGYTNNYIWQLLPYLLKKEELCVNHGVFKDTAAWRNLDHVAIQTGISALSVSYCAFFQQVTHILPPRKNLR